jgi:hypothetical protein
MVENLDRNENSSLAGRNHERDDHGRLARSIEHWRKGARDIEQTGTAGRIPYGILSGTNLDPHTVTAGASMSDRFPMIWDRHSMD